MSQLLQRRVILLLFLAIVAAPAASAAASPKPTSYVFLRDGRRIPGRVRTRRGPWLLIESKAGPLTIPAWMLDPSPRSRELWAGMTPISGPESPELLKALRRRALQVASRGRGRGTVEQLTKYQERISNLIKERNDRELGRAARALERLAYRLPAWQRARGLELAVRASREAALILSSGADAQAVQAARHYQAALTLLHPKGQGERALLEAILAEPLKQDPRRRETAVQVLHATEGFAAALKLTSDQSWRTRARKPGPETEAEGQFRVVAADGAVKLQPQPPRTLKDVESVELAVTLDPKVSGAVPGEGTATNYTLGWRRVFWCPVAKAWKEPTVPEQLHQERVPLYGFLTEQLAEEAKDLMALAQAHARHGRDLDELARGYDPRRNALSGDASALIERLTGTRAELLEHNERLLRRRLSLHAAYGKLRQLDQQMALALAGRGPGSKIAGSEADSGQDEAAALVAALGAFDPEERLRALADRSLAEHSDNPQVLAALMELLKDEFAPFAQRAKAARVLQSWDYAPCVHYLMQQIEVAATDAEASQLAAILQANHNYWEWLALRRQEHPLLLKIIFSRLAEAEDADDAAAALASLAPMVLVPKLQVAALEALGRLKQYDAIAETIFQLRYPMARERARAMLAKVLDPRAEAVAILIEGEKLSRDWPRRRRGQKGNESPANPEEFRDHLWERLESSGAIRKITRMPDGLAFLGELRLALDPHQLYEDQLLQRLYQSSNIYAGKLADMTEVRERTMERVFRLASLERLAGQAEFQGLLVAFGNEDSVKAAMAVLRDQDAPEADKIGAVHLLSHSRQSKLAEFLLACLDERPLQQPTVRALRKITGRDDLRTVVDWKNWDKRLAVD